RSPSHDPARPWVSSAYLTEWRCRSTRCSAETSACAAAAHPPEPTSLSSSTTSWKGGSIPGASSTSRPTSTASVRRTQPWTNAARSSRLSGWGRFDPSSRKGSGAAFEALLELQLILRNLLPSLHHRERRHQLAQPVTHQL